MAGNRIVASLCIQKLSKLFSRGSSGGKSNEFETVKHSERTRAAELAWMATSKSRERNEADSPTKAKQSTILHGDGWGCENCIIIPLFRIRGSTSPHPFSNEEVSHKRRIYGFEMDFLLDRPPRSSSNDILDDGDWSAGLLYIWSWTCIACGGVHSTAIFYFIMLLHRVTKTGVGGSDGGAPLCGRAASPSLAHKTI